MALNTGLFNVAPGESPKDGDARRRLAMALMQEGMSTEPIRSPWQGAANIAKSMLGGYDLYKMDQEDAAKEARMQNGVESEIRMLGPQGGAPPMGGQPPMGAPPPVAAALSGGAPRPPGMIPGANGEPPRPKVPSSPSIMGDDEAVKAGLYDAPRGPQGPAMAQANPAQSPVASALAGRPAQPVTQLSQGPERRTPAISQEEMDALLRMSKNPSMRAPLMQHLMDLQKPKDQFEPGVTPEGIQYDRNKATGKREWSPAAPNMSVTTVADPVLKGVGEQLMEARSRATTASTQSIPAIHEARKALDQGAITGALSDPRLFISKVGSLFGIGDVSKIANTEQLSSALGTQVLADAKSLGANPSNADRAVIEKIKGSKQLDEQSLRQILDMQERWARDSIKRHNITADKLMRGNPKMYEQIAPIMSIEEPGKYSAPPKPAYKPTPEEAAAELERRRAAKGAK